MKISKLLTALAITVGVLTAQAQTANTTTSTSTQEVRKSTTQTTRPASKQVQTKTKVNIKEDVQRDATGRPVKTVKQTNTEKKEIKQAPSTPQQPIR